MPAICKGDYSKYPEPLRDLIPYLEGEVCDLRGCWQVFKHVFMTNESRTRVLGERLGGLLGTYQGLLQDDMMISIARLMDADRGKHSNLSMWALAERCQKWDPTVAAEVTTLLKRLSEKIEGLRTHRHKRIAHFDLPVSLGHSQLPTVTFAEIRESIEQLEAILNLVSQRAGDTTIMFEMLDHREITAAAEVTVCKALAYDAAVADGRIDSRSWRNYAFD